MNFKKYAIDFANWIIQEGWLPSAKHGDWYKYDFEGSFMETIIKTTEELWENFDKERKKLITNDN